MGVSRSVAKATGFSRRAIRVGKKDLRDLRAEEKNIASSKAPGIRKPGGGRKKTATKDPDLIKDLNFLVNPSTRGDPQSPLRWTCKSVRKLAD